MTKSYGTENFNKFLDEPKFISPQPIVQDLNFRQIHLKSRLDSFLNQCRKQTSNQDENERLKLEAKTLIDKLEELKREFEQIHLKLRQKGILVATIVENYRKNLKDFDKILSNFHQINGNDPFRMENLQKLPSDQNFTSINAIVDDFDFRKMNLSRILENESISKELAEKVTKKLEKLENYAQELIWLRQMFREIRYQTEIYVRLLIDERQPDFYGSKFIFIMEELRIETERLEIGRNFPRTTELMNDWWKDFGSVDNFKPKVLDLCQSLEEDLKNCFRDRNSIYNVPLKIGVVGQTSVGKSALIMKIASLENYAAMINLERSTFGYLEFDVFLSDRISTERKIPITFIDIAGATDDDTSKSIGNYFELITNADCDLYMIVFDKPFNKQYQLWLDFIEKNLRRKVLLVRSKIDLSFGTFYKDITGKKFQSGTNDSYDIRLALEKTRQHAKTTFDEKQIETKIFLTAAGEENELKNEDFGQFDLEKLKGRIRNLAEKDLRIIRVEKLALNASKAAINTCFRRDYVVCQTKYRWLAAGASLVPFLDEVPAFFGREQIRQAFGVHDRSSMMNMYQKTKNSLEEYLLTHRFSVPKETFKSGYFEYLISNEKENSTNSSSSATRSSTFFPGPGVFGTTFSVVGAIGQLFRDTLKAALPAATGVLKVVSLVGIIVGLVLTPVTAVWSFYSSGKRMNRHLHLLCDDIQMMLFYFIDHICSEYKIISEFSDSSVDQSLSDSSDED